MMLAQLFLAEKINDMSDLAEEMSDPSGTHIKGDQRGDPEKKRLVLIFRCYSFLQVK